MYPFLPIQVFLPRVFTFHRTTRRVGGPTMFLISTTISSKTMISPPGSCSQ